MSSDSPAHIFMWGLPRQVKTSILRDFLAELLASAKQADASSDPADRRHEIIDICLLPCRGKQPYAAPKGSPSAEAPDVSTSRIGGGSPIPGTRAAFVDVASSTVADQILSGIKRLPLHQTPDSSSRRDGDAPSTSTLWNAPLSAELHLDTGGKKPRPSSKSNGKRVATAPADESPGPSRSFYTSGRWVPWCHSCGAVRAAEHAIQSLSGPTSCPTETDPPPSIIEVGDRLQSTLQEVAVTAGPALPAGHCVIECDTHRRQRIVSALCADGEAEGFRLVPPGWRPVSAASGAVAFCCSWPVVAETYHDKPFALEGCSTAAKPSRQDVSKALDSVLVNAAVDSHRVLGDPSCFRRPCGVPPTGTNLTLASRLATRGGALLRVLSGAHPTTHVASDVVHLLADSRLRSLATASATLPALHRVRLGAFAASGAAGEVDAPRDMVSSPKGPDADMQDQTSASQCTPAVDQDPLAAAVRVIAYPRRLGLPIAALLDAAGIPVATHGHLLLVVVAAESLALHPPSSSSSGLDPSTPAAVREALPSTKGSQATCGCDTPSAAGLKFVGTSTAEDVPTVRCSRPTIRESHPKGPHKVNDILRTLTSVSAVEAARRRCPAAGDLAAAGLRAAWGARTCLSGELWYGLYGPDMPAADTDSSAGAPSTAVSSPLPTVFSVFRCAAPDAMPSGPLLPQKESDCSSTDDDLPAVDEPTPQQGPRPADCRPAASQPPCGLNRAVHKVAEAISFARTWRPWRFPDWARLDEDVNTLSGVRAIDVGAAPGGWTYHLVASSAASLVVAVDPAQLWPALVSGAAGDGRVLHLQMLAETASAAAASQSHHVPTAKRNVCVQRAVTDPAEAGILLADSAPFHLLVCDANVDPRDAARALVKPLLPLCADGAIIILTMKYKRRVSDRQRRGVLQEVRRILQTPSTSSAPKVDLLDEFHLLANTRCERTALGIVRCAPPSS
eukprot:TRINITY_DN44163_c0_g1_i1.p1 TRINITY_DN44163_c0_g1~~TRINITY_DN44163_c0_g1_i1.p1  ORF type:complete len:1001 (+),score=27.93 TRINITY_DN44163_c0_g1_i1:128-3004(+)